MGSSSSLARNNFLSFTRRWMSRVLYLLFFLSGASGLIYQVIWVREFGNVFGNTVHSASLVIAVFMCGLGLGSYLAGRWADRRYAVDPESLIRAYGYCELAIAAMGFLVSLLLPHLGGLSPLISSYTRETATRWYVLSVESHLARYVIAVLLLAPITLVMGSTLTILIRYLIRRDLGAVGWRIGALYGVNTAGGAAGCFLTDYAFVPGVGLRATQMIAVLLNLLAAFGALRLARRELPATPTASAIAETPDAQGEAAAGSPPWGSSRSVVLAGLALALSGVAAMGMEIVWFRHVEMLLGPFRSVFSLLLTVILLGLWLGALAGGYLHRRRRYPALWYMLAQALFVVSTLLGLGTADINRINAEQWKASATFFATSGWTRQALELWLNVHPILREVALPALMLGVAYPLANAIIQRAVDTVGRHAGFLYFANTLGAVLGAVVAGFVLLPILGLQRSASFLILATALGLVPLYVASRTLSISTAERRTVTTGFCSALTAVVAALAVWLTLPSNHVIARSLPLPGPGERWLAVREGLTEVVAVTEIPGEGRRLMTNGHSMSATLLFSQRYMRAFSHIPLLSMEAPERVLVIGFGVGNTLHAASLHPSVRLLDTVDLSRTVLEHAPWFATTTANILQHPKLAVYVNDGRHHLRMQAPATYDLVTMEPPPIAHAGVAALYSHEFYELVRTRLKPAGYISQWLPAYQVPEETTLSIVRAFIEVFPQSVLLSGAGLELILMGTTGAQIEIDPARLEAKLRSAPAVAADLRRLYLGTPMEIIGTFAASAETLASATKFTRPVTDDYPIMEYATRSRLAQHRHRNAVRLFDVSSVATWCPKCFVNRSPVPGLEDLGPYLTLLGRLYQSPPFREFNSPPRPNQMAPTFPLDETERRIVASHPYFRFFGEAR